MFPINGPTGPKGPDTIKKKKPTGGQGGVAFGSFLEEDETEAQQVTAPVSVMAANPFLALQEVSDQPLPTDQQAKAHGEQLLSQLDKLRLGLLNGSLPRSHIQQLTEMVKRERGMVSDPKLAAILDEIDVRAAVELAKIEAEQQKRDKEE